jgi:hypothetical protein
LDKHEASVVEDSWFGAKLANSMPKRQEGGVELLHLKSVYLGKKSRSNNRMIEQVAMDEDVDYPTPRNGSNFDQG